MDNLSSILSNLSEQDINSLKQAAASLLSGNSDSECAPVQENPKSENLPGISGLPGIDASTAIKLGAVMGALNREDNRCELIRALKPHLKPERRKKADEAIKMLKIISILPVLREQNLF